MTKTVSVVHKQRINTAANWAASNPVLLPGQIGVVSDTTPVKFKIGDGATTWNNLKYAGDAFVSLGTATSVANMPIDKSHLSINVSANEALSYASTPAEGFHQVLFLGNRTTGYIDITIPNSNGWVSYVRNNYLSMQTMSNAELHIFYQGGIFYTILSTYRMS